MFISLGGFYSVQQLATDVSFQNGVENEFLEFQVHMYIDCEMNSV